MLRATLLAAAVFLVASDCRAQNVTGYSSIPNPYLLLLREPAVHSDLRLTSDQATDLAKLNDRIDGPLLAMRNKTAAEADATFERLVGETQEALTDILTANQRQRLGQIMLRIRGIKSVVTPSVAKRLKLTEQQQTDLGDILDRATKEVEELNKKLADGASQAQILRQIEQVRTREQKQILGKLTTSQQTAIRDVFGRPFDPTKLGRTKFKAPELVDSAGWINTDGVRLADLRGEVVAVHFWAFG